MLRRIFSRTGLLVMFALVFACACVLIFLWKQASDNGGQKPAEPFRIAGNLYYVGANDVTSFLLTGPDGHVLIDGGYPGTAKLIMASIAKLGFTIRDVKVLLNSHAHFDHAGGLAELQKASGAELWVSAGDADMIASGGDDPDLGIARLLVWSGLVRYPAPRVNQRFEDGAKVRLGPTELTAHVTPGHTKGCTSWSFVVHEGARVLQVVEVCSVEAPASIAMVAGGDTSKLRADFAQTFATLRSLPVDIFLTSHARKFDRWRKYQESLKAADPVAPFVDPEGFRAYLDAAEARLAGELAK